ncbi:MAG: phenylpyruvate tautomerase MIF-related protein [Christensenellales bacterium]|jgi:phenylpyruvate tautomerase PptA (4-oxalocrotonate tautomerase family)
MPYIRARIGTTITEDQKTAIKADLGKKIEALPGKAESGLMVDIADGCDLYYQGNKGNCAFVGVYLYKSSPRETKAKFAQLACECIAEHTGVCKNNVYINFCELHDWFGNGQFLE